MTVSERMNAPPKTRQIVGIVLSQILVELALAQLEMERFASVAQSESKKTREPTQPSTAARVVRVEAANGQVDQVEATRTNDSQPREKRKRPSPRDASTKEPRAVVWLKDPELVEERELDAKRLIDAVNKEARTFGVRPGQSIAEARSLVSHLAISTIGTRVLQGALERVAEAMTRFGTTVALALPDTVWVEVTGTTHLFGGDWTLLEEMSAVLDEMGHRARLAMADGPQLARAFAEWETRRQGRSAVVIAPEDKHSCLKALPLTSLPIPDEIKVGLAQLGLLTAGDLLERDSTVVSSRLGDRAATILTLLRGEDTAPLAAHRPLELPTEVLDWDEPLSGSEPILFALRRLTTRVAARLRGRGLAAQTLELTLKHDAAIARFRGKETSSRHVVQLVAPLAREEDLWRVLTAKVLKIQVEVPNVGVSLRVLQVEETKQRQLDLAVGFSKLDAADPERLAVLFSELASDIGAENFGTLRLANTHKPEKVTLLSPVSGAHSNGRGAGRKGRRKDRAPSSMGNSEQLGLGEHRSCVQGAEPAIDFPTRLLATAIPVQTRFKVGELLPLGPKLYTITRVTFQRRLEAVEWWSSEPCSRDYVRLWLSSIHGELQVLAYVDRVTQTRFVQGWYD